MKTFSSTSGTLKFIIGWLVVFAIRLVPFRPPNFEPMLATMMPFGKRYGFFGSFAFGFLGIALFDAVTTGIGMWTAVTAVAYGLLGVGARYFFRSRKGSVANFLGFGIIGTIAYDAVTGLSIGPLFYGQPFIAALIGQIPFTLMHLLGTSVFAVTVSPLVYRWVVENEALETKQILDRFGVHATGA